MVETIKFDADGRRVWPEVKIGNERLARGGTSSGLAKGFVACNVHGTTRQCWVRWRKILTVCCRLCIVQHCEIVEAVMRPNYAAEGADALGADMDHPDGHSY